MQDTKAPKTALAREANSQPLKSSSKSSQALTQTQSWVARQVGPFHQHIRLRFSAITKCLERAAEIHAVYISHCVEVN